MYVGPKPKPEVTIMEPSAHPLVLVIVEAARASGLSTYEIAKRTGIPRGTVRDLMTTNANRNASDLLRIAEAVGAKLTVRIPKGGDPRA